MTREGCLRIADIFSIDLAVLNRIWELHGMTNSVAEFNLKIKFISHVNKKNGKEIKKRGKRKLKNSKNMSHSVWLYKYNKAALSWHWREAMLVGGGWGGGQLAGRVGHLLCTWKELLTVSDTIFLAFQELPSSKNTQHHCENINKAILTFHTHIRPIQLSYNTPIPDFLSIFTT